MPPGLYVVKPVAIRQSFVIAQWIVFMYAALLPYARVISHHVRAVEDPFLFLGYIASRTNRDIRQMMSSLMART